MKIGPTAWPFTGFRQTDRQTTWQIYIRFIENLPRCTVFHGESAIIIALSLLEKKVVSLQSLPDLLTCMNCAVWCRFNEIPPLRAFDEMSLWWNANLMKCQFGEMPPSPPKNNFNFSFFPAQNQQPTVVTGSRSKCYKTFYWRNLLPFLGNTIILCYNAGSRLATYKTFYWCNLLPFQGKAVILCYKTLLSRQLLWNGSKLLQYCCITLLPNV